MLFRSMMHVASGRIRRKPVRLCHKNVCVLREIPSHKARYGQNCVSPVSYWTQILPESMRVERG